MKQVLKKILSITALLSFVAVQANNVTPTLVYRSQGFHGDRQRNVGMVGHINLYDMESWYGTFDLGVGYMRSFDSEKIARSLFGCDLICNSDCNNTIKVQGSSVASRDANAWLADYLYLGCDYDGSFSINPRIQNVVVDLDFYLGLDEWVNGMYFRIYGPINWTKWQTKFCVTDPATVVTTSCSTGYFSPSGDEVLLSSMSNYFAGSAPAIVDGITFQGLKYAKMPACDETKVSFAELRLELGWNFFQDDDYHVGAGLHAAAPTGTKRCAEYVMQPVSGNGNHWELGGTLHGHYVFWRSDDEEQHFGLYLDAVLTHLFRADELRTFDLCGKDNSRYMLATKFTSTITNGSTNGLGGVTSNGVAGTKTAVTSEFNNVYAPLANLTTADVKVSVGIQADVVAMFNFTTRGFAWDLGYNFWGRSCESIKCPTDCSSCNSDSIFNTANANTWALKGDARMFGFAAIADAPIALNDTVPLSATQSAADIHAGTNVGTVDATLTSVTMQNGGVDNSQFAVTGPTPVRVIHTPTTQGGFDANSDQIKTSIQPVFIKSTDVGLQETKGMSHKIFTHLSYTWDRDNWIPYLGIGGSGEFGRNACCSGCTSCSTSSSCTTSCTTTSGCCSSSSSCDCLRSSLSQWSIWVKGGISFNQHFERRRPQPSPSLLSNN